MAALWSFLLDRLDVERSILRFPSPLHASEVALRILAKGNWKIESFLWGGRFGRSLLCPGRAEKKTRSSWPTTGCLPVDRNKLGAPWTARAPALARTWPPARIKRGAAALGREEKKNKYKPRKKLLHQPFVMNKLKKKKKKKKKRKEKKGTRKRTGHGGKKWQKVEGALGVEPRTSWSAVKCSTTELYARHAFLQAHCAYIKENDADRELAVSIAERASGPAVG